MNQGSKAVITVPVTVQRSVLKHREKARLKRLEQIGTKYFEGHRNLPPIISCRVPQLNHYRGQVYSPFKTMPMATAQWHNRGSIGDFFTVVPFHGNYSAADNWNKFALQKFREDQDLEISSDVLSHLQSPSFAPYGFDDSIVQTLKKLGFRSPTNIQDAAFPQLLSGENAIVASETGNGKTLAFLLPVIQQVLQHKRRNPSLTDRPFNSPFSVIITPGRELASQIFDVAEQICDDLGIATRLELGGSTDRKILHGDRKETDLLIGSLGGLRKLFFGNLLHRDYVTSVVLDEVDTLVDDTFSEKTVGLLTYLCSQTGKKFGTASHLGYFELPLHQLCHPFPWQGCQMIFVGATFPHNIKNALRDLLDTDDLNVIQTHYLHRVLSHVKQKFVRAPKVGRPAYLLDVIEPDVQKSRPVLIFSNKSSTASFVSKFLCERGIECRHFSSKINWRVRGQILDDFLVGKFSALSCTDLVSRGIDTSKVFHVVNYDFPSNVSDYIHRAGRVGRIGTSQPQGHVTSLVCGRSSIEVVRQIERSVRTNAALSEVDNNIIRIIRKRGRKPSARRRGEVEGDVAADDASDELGRE